MFNSENRVPLRALIILLAGLALLAACTHGRDWDTYDVRIVTDPPGAECKFERNGVGTQAHALTPVDVTLTTGNSRIKVTCFKLGYALTTATVSSIFRDVVYLRLAPAK
ncbi:MAG: hypothetical protein HOJ90_03780 [Alphaproteobacteria bacterium]|nr:hypothetical protein [Alphaproteobacteria bacterium]